MRPAQEAEYRDYVSVKLEPMRYFAYLSCGDWHRAEDAVQIAFEKLYSAWGRAARESLDAYTRKIIVNTVINEHRRAWFRRERPFAELPEFSRTATEDNHAERLSLLDALSVLSERRRVTLVLRFWEDLSVEQTAQIMGCSESTVKSQTARGLQTLRGLLTESIPAAEGIAT